tara:strand:- start:395 stop:514 length:120 start_codon:yes stop_codon:yes gene_type:complete
MRLVSVADSVEALPVAFVAVVAVVAAALLLVPPGLPPAV